MSISIILISIVAAFIIFISLAIFGLWHTYRIENMIGGLILMWVVILIFILVAFFSETTKAGPDKNSSRAIPSSFSKF